MAKTITKLWTDESGDCGFKFEKGSSRFLVIVFVDKKKIKAPGLQFQPQQLYCELMRRLLYDNSPPLEKSTLIVDEAVAKIHHKEFNWVLKKYLSKNITAKIKQKRSKGEVMIQVADMIAGSIHRKYKKGDERFYSMVKNKEKILLEF